MNPSLGTTRVEDVMSSTVFSVAPTDKIENVAKILEKHDVNAAPVVDSDNVCLGIITSHDMVEFEAMRREVESRARHGQAFDLAHYGDGDSASNLGRPIDEVAHHMSTNVETVGVDSPLSRAARTMCQKHIHHLIVVDDANHPVGVLSSLDILGHLLGEPITRGQSRQQDDD